MRKIAFVFSIIFLLVLCLQSLGKSDELQEQYLSRLRDINFNLKKAHLDWLYNMKMGVATKDIDRKIDSLKNDKENLKIDALKYYKGKLPKSLSLGWKEEELDYSNYINKNFAREVQKMNQELKRKGY